MNRRDRAWRAWIIQPLTHADLLHLELGELRRLHHRQARIDHRFTAAIDAAVRDARARGNEPDPAPRQMVQTDDWPTIRMPGSRSGQDVVDEPNIAIEQPPTDEAPARAVVPPINVLIRSAA